MKTIVLSIGQIRKWATPYTWMIGGYSNTHEILYLSENRPPRVQLSAGGWTLSASSYLCIEWEGEPDEECLYRIVLNQNSAYRGLWTPKLLETVTESFFWDGDLFVINYRLLKVVVE